MPQRQRYRPAVRRPASWPLYGAFFILVVTFAGGGLSEWVKDPNVGRARRWKEEPRLQTPQDGRLLDTLLEDPQAGLAAILDQYGAMVNAIVRRILPQDPQDAEECVADVLVAAWRNAAGLRQGGHSLKGWLCLTARNAALNRWRALHRRPNLPLEEAVAGDWLLAPQPTEAEELIQALVDALPEPDREIFIRRYYFLEPAAEIGRAVGMAAHTVTVRLSRGRDKLRRQFIQAQKEEVCHV